MCCVLYLCIRAMRITSTMFGRVDYCCRTIAFMLCEHSHQVSSFILTSITMSGLQWLFVIPIILYTPNSVNHFQMTFLVEINMYFNCSRWSPFHKARKCSCNTLRHVTTAKFLRYTTNRSWRTTCCLCCSDNIVDILIVRALGKNRCMHNSNANVSRMRMSYERSYDGCIML